MELKMNSVYIKEKFLTIGSLNQSKKEIIIVTRK